MVKRKRAALLPTNIALLQNLIKRDPPSYREEFLLQYRHYESLRDIFLENSGTEQGSEELADLVGFVSQMCTCFPQDTKTFPNDLFQILSQRHHELPADLREKIVQSITMLRNKGIITSEQLIQSLFPILISTDSKQLRSQVYSSIITLIKSVNQGAKNQKVNRSVQALLFNLLTDAESNGLWATKITRELWRRGIWDDSRTVEIMTQAAQHANIKVSVSAAKFFLGADKERDEAQQSDDEEEIDMTSLRHKMQINKKSGKRGKKLEQAVKTLKKRGQAHHSATYLNFSAIHLLRDPQGFADNLFSTHLSRGGTKLNLEQKIIFMNLISRLVGVHKLTVLGLYSFFLKYLTPKQKDVTQIMAAAAQAAHDLVPPDVISPVIRKIADEFVSDGVAAEVAAAGINTIREIVSRAPLSIDKTLLQDLIEYKGSKSKPVMMAARSLIGLYRELDPSMLHSRDRGKVAAMAMKDSNGVTPKFGVEAGTTNGIEGLELFRKWREEQGVDNNDEEADDGWEVASDEEDEESDSDAEGWVQIESDQEYEVSDSDDDTKDNKNDEDNQLPDAKKSKLDVVATDADAFMKLASTTVLTPADFAKIDELKLAAGVEKAMGKQKPGLKNEEQVDAATLVGPLKYKQLREEKIAAAREGKEDREFGSRKARHQDKAHSTTNKDKARKKNFMMMIHKKDVQGKAKRSLRDKQKSLQAHISKQKKKGF